MTRLLTFMIMLALVTTTRAETNTPPTGLPSASAHQQTAIADIVSAFKELQKAISIPSESQPDDQEAGGSPEKKEKDPFEDKQTYKAPPPDKATNPEAQLDKLVEKQKDVVDSLENQDAPQDGQQGSGEAPPKQESTPKPDDKKQTPPDAGKNAGTQPPKDTKGNGSGDKPSLADLAKRQADIEAKLDSMKKNPALPAKTDDDLSHAAESAAEAKQAMESGAAKESDISAEKTLAEMEQALADIRASSAQNMQATLDTAQKDINGADHALTEEKDPVKAAQDIQAALDRIDSAVTKQHDAGSQEAAEKLASLAAQLASNAPLAELKSLDGQSAASAPGGTNATGQAKGKGTSPTGSGGTNGPAGAAEKKLDDMHKAIAKARGASTMGAGEMAEKIGQLEKLADALEKMSGSSPGNGEASSQGKAMQADAELHMQDLLAAVAHKNPEINSDLKSFMKTLAKTGQGTGERNNPDPDNKNESGVSGDRPTNMPPNMTKQTSSPNAEHLEGLIRGARAILFLARQNTPEAEHLPWVRTYSPDEVPEAYRKDVVSYFEALSESEHPKRADDGK